MVNLADLLMTLLLHPCIVLILLLFRLLNYLWNLKQEFLNFTSVFWTLLAGSSGYSVLKSLFGSFIMANCSKFSSDIKHQITVFDTKSDWFLECLESTVDSLPVQKHSKGHVAPDIGVRCVENVGFWKDLLSIFVFFEIEASYTEVHVWEGSFIITGAHFEHDLSIMPFLLIDKNCSDSLV